MRVVLDTDGPALDQVDLVGDLLGGFVPYDVGEFSWHSILKTTVDEDTGVAWCMKVAGTLSVECGFQDPFGEAGALMFACASRKPLVIVIVEDKIARESGVDWYQYCRDLCSAEIEPCHVLLAAWYGSTAFIALCLDQGLAATAAAKFR
ncbi:hypothetical protein H257_00251 [Aphanomyces astaci]|uniref:Uncharacterized protein n=1 Tax=Aphanomyces astaci TaxID=112090 RepID=W4H9Y7_APHAT|nr:hypothetical protein H257_00251 [Aphanomyces astaci]ETV88737.1 hypothetical protein H257_00251 [Aphanomyces astaci]|eukprot:XP_009821137.1 hypothetical protein H257_00251 [Aphanomyces astaci]